MSYLVGNPEDPLSHISAQMLHHKTKMFEFEFTKRSDKLGNSLSYDHVQNLHCPMINKSLGPLKLPISIG